MPEPFSGATPFSGASDLSVSTTRNIVVSSGSSVTTASGDLTLSANRQGSPTSGNFHGISVSGTVSTTDGTLMSQDGPVSMEPLRSCTV